MNEARMHEYIISRYDDINSSPELPNFFGQTEYLNFGYWNKDTTDQKQACENLMEQLLSYIPEKSGTILDVACGKGATTAYLLKYYQPQNITGINISESQMRIAEANAPGCTFLKMNARGYILRSAK